MALLSFLVASKANPGYTTGLPLLKSSNDEENCHICDAAKPERTHHCSKCMNCVFNMDHHCVWIDNCVGVNNRKAFTLLLWWAAISLMIGGSGGVYVSIDLVNLIVFNFKLFSIRMILSYIVLIAILLAMAFNGLAFFAYASVNFFNILKDVNMIERFFGYQATWNIKSPKRNFFFYFGKNPIFWLIPFGTPNLNKNPKEDFEGDGV